MADSPTSPAAPGPHSPAAQSLAVGSPIRPGSSLSPYLTQAHASDAFNKSVGKGKHINTVKSLGLLHDLHDYIQTVEAEKHDARRELERIREEKRELEKVMYRVEVRQDKGAYNEFFSNQELQDMPPRLRAIVEDNRALKDKVKKYKSRNSALDAQALALQNQVLALTEVNDKLKHQLSECSRTPAEVAQEASLKTRLEEQTQMVSKLEHSVAVLKAKGETDAKLTKSALSQAAREKDVVMRQLAASHRQLEEQDKDIRSLQLELRRSQRKAVPVRPGTVARSTEPTASIAGTEILPDVSAARGLLPSGLMVLSPALPPRPVLEAETSSVHLMLMLVDAAGNDTQADESAAPEQQQEVQQREEPAPAEPQQAEEVEQQQVSEPQDAEPEHASSAADQEGEEAAAPAEDPPAATDASSEGDAGAAEHGEHAPPAADEEADADARGMEESEADANAVAHEEEPAPDPDDLPAPEVAEEGAADESALLSHNSPPASIPYSRTAARLGARNAGNGSAGGAAGKPSPPAGSKAAGGGRASAAGVAGRKSGASAAGSKGAAPKGK